MFLGVCAWRTPLGPCQSFSSLCVRLLLYQRTDHWMGRITVDSNRFLDLPLSSRWMGPEDAQNQGTMNKGGKHLLHTTCLTPVMWDNPYNSHLSCQRGFRE